MRPSHRLLIVWLIINVGTIVILVVQLSGRPRHQAWMVALVTFVMVNLVTILSFRRELRKRRDKQSPL